jgi:hypothetical protein
MAFSRIRALGERLHRATERLPGDLSEVLLQGD